MALTWGMFKHAVESYGVTDNDRVARINVTEVGLEEADQMQAISVWRICPHSSWASSMPSWIKIES